MRAWKWIRITLGFTTVALVLWNKQITSKAEKYVYADLPLNNSYKSLIKCDTGETMNQIQQQKGPIAWVIVRKLNVLKHVLAVLELVGYQWYSTTNDSTLDRDWDVMWTHSYPFYNDLLKPILQNLKPHQKVNQFPGSDNMTLKSSLVRANLSCIPASFILPEDRERLQIFTIHNPNTLFVQKSNNHRGIRITDIKDIDLSGQSGFIQEFIGRPYLIDGYRFDIGIYTTLLSVDPLRVYVYEGDWSVRFCKEPFYPLHVKNTKKYVVGDPFKPIWTVKSLKQYFYDFDLTFKETLLSYMRKTGIDVDKLLSALYSAVREVYYNRELYRIQALSGYKYPRNFFEMVRMDFVLDEDMKVYLMEANLSPNLVHDDLPPNKRMFEGLLYSLFSLVGIASYSKTGRENRTSYEHEMTSSIKHLSVYRPQCETCSNCHLVECMLCKSCLTQSHIHQLRHAFLEHTNKQQWRRIIPKPFQSESSARQWDHNSDRSYTALSDSNKWMSIWFHSKCLQDSNWCS